MVGITGRRSPDSLNFIQKVETAGKGTYSAGGREYTYYKLKFTIEHNGEKVEWECCADAVNDSAQAAILGLGAALKVASKRFSTAEEFKKALEGGEDGDPPLVISYGAKFSTEKGPNGRQKIEYDLFEREHLHKGVRPLFKSEKRTTETLVDEEIRHLKAVARAIDMTAKASREPEQRDPGAILERLPDSVRARIVERGEES